MRISVIGPGAMGCLFAGRFQQAGIATTLIDHRSDRAAILEKSGITISTPDGPIRAKPAIALAVPPKQDLILLTIKAHATSTVSLPPGIPILTLQNGLGNVETLCERLGSKFILAGSTYEAATLTGVGEIRHDASGQTHIGSWTSCSVDTAQDALQKAKFQCSVTDAPGQAIWEKAAIASGIEPLTGILRQTNGEILESSESRQLLRDLVVEASKVAATEGYRFPYSLVERAEEVCRESASTRSSMLQDIEAGKTTEIDALSGEILRRAELAGLPAPRTRVICQIISSLRNH